MVVGVVDEAVGGPDDTGGVSVAACVGDIAFVPFAAALFGEQAFAVKNRLKRGRRVVAPVSFLILSHFIFYQSRSIRSLTYLLLRVLLSRVLFPRFPYGLF